MCFACNWEELLDQIEDMLGDSDERFHYAYDTLVGIHEWVEENEHCTEGQKDAVENIFDNTD